MIAALIQPVVHDSYEDNLAEISGWMEEAAAQGAELVILPELFSTPFINDEIKAHAPESTLWLQELKDMAARLSLWIVAGTLPWLQENKCFNRCFVINAQGEIEGYADKLHLLEVHSGKHDYYEADVFTPGSGIRTLDTPWGRMGVVICFDLRMPEICRLISEECFLIAAVCGFNEHVGRKHWQPLVQARAIENEVYVAALNPARHSYPTYTSYGHSMAVSPDGKILGELKEDAGLLLVEIDPEEVQKIRARSPYWKLRRTDLFTLKKR